MWVRIKGPHKRLECCVSASNKENVRAGYQSPSQQKKAMASNKKQALTYHLRSLQEKSWWKMRLRFGLFDQILELELIFKITVAVFLLPWLFKIEDIKVEMIWNAFTIFKKKFEFISHF